MLRKSAISLAILGALGATQANALGLGEIKVSSALNQPFQAEIDLLQLRGLTESQVITGLANTDDFYQAGVQPTAALSDITFKLDITGNQGKIVLTSNDPIREPFLNFLIEVNWPSGRLVREYTVLLDPPVFTAADLVPAKPAAPVAQAQPMQPMAAPVAAPKAATLRPSQYRVKNSDTLWNIALKTRPDRSVSPQQMMLALQQANPDAFIDNNINRLKSGVVLDIPTQADIAALGVKDSMQEVNRQNRNWKGAPAATSKPVAAKLDAADKPMEATPAAADDDAQLRIVSKTADESEQPMAQPVAEAGEDTTAVSAQSMARSEELEAKNEELEEQLVVTLEGLDKVERDNAELFNRLEKLSEQMESMQRLIELKDQQLAAMQNKAPAVAPAATPEAKKSLLDSMPMTWLAGGAAAVLALLLGAFALMRKRREEKEVEEALVTLNEQELVDQEVAGEPEGETAAPAAAEPLDELSEVTGSELDEVDSSQDLDDPFNMESEPAVSDEIDTISDAELDSALSDDLDMDLKLDEPVVEDPEMAEFSNSLLNDDEYDLSTGLDDLDDLDVDASELAEADAGMGSDLDDLLAEGDAEVDLAGEPETSVEDELAEDFGSDLDDLLAETEEQPAEEVVSVEDELGEDFGSDLDDLLADSGEVTLDDEVVADSPESGDELAEDLGSDLDDLLAETEEQAPVADELDDELIDGLDDLLSAADEEPSVEPEQELLDEGADLDALLAENADEQEEPEELADLASVEQAVFGESDEEGIPDDDTLDALLADAETDEAAEESIAALDIESEVSEAVDNDVSDLVVDDLPGQHLDIGDVEEELPEFELDSEASTDAVDDVLDVELDDATDDALDFQLDDAIVEETAVEEVADTVVEEPAAESMDIDTSAAEVEGEVSSLVLEESLDDAADEELEAELEQMLGAEDNQLSLQETDLEAEGDEIDYLDAADEVGTKLDLARAYIDMDDRDGARDILQEVLAEGSEEQISEATGLLESLKG